MKLKLDTKPGSELHKLLIKKSVETFDNKDVLLHSHKFGPQEFEDGSTRDLHIVFSVDPVIANTALLLVINRAEDPFIGQPALPGGWIDPELDGTVEKPISAAAREAAEEAGISEADLGEGKLIDRRRYDLMRNIRIAHGDIPERNIKEGDVFIVSTQAVLFYVANLANCELQAGSDAEADSARTVEISKISKDFFGPPLHYNLVVKSLANHNKVEFADPYLISSAEIDNVEGMEQALNFGANLNATNQYGNTALIRACCEGVVGSVTFLLNQGADRLIKNHDGYTALDVAKKRMTQNPENESYQQIINKLKI